MEYMQIPISKRVFRNDFDLHRSDFTTMQYVLKVEAFW